MLNFCDFIQVYVFTTNHHLNRSGDLSLPRKRLIRLTDCPDMTLDVGGGRVVRWSWVNFQCRGVLQFGL